MREKAATEGTRRSQHVKSQTLEQLMGAYLEEKIRIKELQKTVKTLPSHIQGDGLIEEREKRRAEY